MVAKQLNANQTALAYAAPAVTVSPNAVCLISLIVRLGAVVTAALAYCADQFRIGLAVLRGVLAKSAWCSAIGLGGLAPSRSRAAERGSQTHRR